MSPGGPVLGVAWQQERGRRRDRLQWAASSWEPLPLDGEVARAYGRLYATMPGSGRASRRRFAEPAHRRDCPGPRPAVITRNFLWPGRPHPGPVIRSSEATSLRPLQPRATKCRRDSNNGHLWDCRSGHFASAKMVSSALRIELAGRPGRGSGSWSRAWVLAGEKVPLLGGQNVPLGFGRTGSAELVQGCALD